MRKVSRESRWRSEAEFFDRIAEREAPAGLDPLVAIRYGGPLRGIYAKEFCFSLLGDPRGLKILDLGCGIGDNALLMAHLGAHVTGIDISPRSIEVAMDRAARCGLEERVRFYCGPVEEVEPADKPFDVVFADGVLHHLLDSLEQVFERLSSWSKPGALAIFKEPTNLAPGLRWLRGYIPIHTEATPDERPLEAAELDIIKRWIPHLRSRHFQMLGRLNRFVLEKGSYERSSLARRLAADALAWTDTALLSLPYASRFGGTAILWGHFGLPAGRTNDWVGTEEPRKVAVS